jgi:cytochrome P450
MTQTQDALDAFEKFNRATGLGKVRTPYPAFAEARKKGPLIPASEMPSDSVDQMTTHGIEGPEPLVAVHFDAAQQILRDPDHFSSSLYANTMGIVMGPTVLQMDPPEHTLVRALLQKAFSRGELKRWEHELVGPVVHELIDAFAERGRADLVREFTFPFPVTVMAGMLGVPRERAAEFQRLAVEIISIAIDPATAMQARQGLEDLLRPLLEQRKQMPQQDLLSILAHAEIEGERLSDELIYSFCRLLAPAGAETTYRSSSNLLFGLFTHSGQLDALRADRSLMPRAIEEGVRWEVPLTSIARVCKADTVVCGVSVKAGTPVRICMGAANHDEKRWENPEEFDIQRPVRQHIGFAAGPHTCLGMHLARMETTVALNALLDRLPNLRLDPEALDVHIAGEGFRAPVALPVLFDPGT